MSSQQQTGTSSRGGHNGSARGAHQPSAHRKTVNQPAFKNVNNSTSKKKAYVKASASDTNPWDLSFETERMVQDEVMFKNRLLQLLTSVYKLSDAAVAPESIVHRLYNMLKENTSSPKVILNRLTICEETIFQEKPSLGQLDKFWNFISACVKKADGEIPEEANTKATKSIVQTTDNYIDQINSVLQKLKLFEAELLGKDKRLEKVIAQCTNDRTAITESIASIQEVLRGVQEQIAALTPASSASPLGTRSIAVPIKAPLNVPTSASSSKLIVSNKPASAPAAVVTPASVVAPAAQKKQEKIVEVTRNTATSQPAQVNANKVQIIPSMVEACISEAKFADAARLALQIPIGQLPNQLLFGVIKALEAPELLPPSALHNMIQLLFSALSGKTGASLDEVIDRQRSLVNYFARRMTIRRFEYIVSILSQFYIAGPLPFWKSLPLVETKAPRLLKLRQLLKFQTHIAAMLVGSPKDSHNILMQYKPVFAELVKELQTMTYALHETSLEAVRQYDPALNLHMEEEDEPATNALDGASKQQKASTSRVVIPERILLDISSASTNALTEEANAIFEKLAPSSEETASKAELIEELSVLCKYVIPQSEVYVYGSSASNLGIKGSDIDMCIKLNQDISSDNNLQTSLLTLVCKAMKQDFYDHLSPAEQPVTRSRVPVLQVKDRKRGFDCDICIGTLLGVTNTKMLKLYSEFDSRVRPLSYVVKYWAKSRHINDPPSGSLSSYSYVLLVINYLQSIDNPILPSFQDLLTHPLVEPSDISQPSFVNAYDCRYVCNLEKLHSIWNENTKNKSNLGQLVLGFFTHYGATFDFNHQTASVRLGCAIEKRSQSVISIEDPFEKRELGGVVSDAMVPKIVEEFKRAYGILANGGSIADIVEERTTATNEVNIYNIKQDYADHITIGEAEKLIASGELKSGTLRVNKRKFKEAYVKVEGIDKDVFIDGFKPRNRAMHGDLVAIKVSYERKVTVHFGSGEKSASDTIEPVNSMFTVTGTVVCIMTKKSPKYFPCTVMKQDDDQNQGFRWLLPMDTGFPKIMVRFDEFNKAFNARASELEEVITIVEMDPWTKTRHFPKGKIVGVLGLKRDLWSQKRAILMQQMPSLFSNVLSTSKNTRDNENKAVAYVEGANISTETKKAENLLKNRESWDINNIEIDIEKEIAGGYVDLRGRRVFTIDPSSSRDLDDALSIEHFEGEWYRVTVYIADVTRFVKEGDVTDLEARKRATSVYMIDIVDHMLDPSLSQNLCSLLPGVTRFSVAVEVIMNTKGEVRDETIHFTRCIIRSCCRMDYDSVQEVLEGRQLPEDKRRVTDGFEWKDLAQDLIVLNQMTQSLRKKRHEGGSVELSNQELDFELDSDGYPMSVAKSLHNESHQLIEEYALLANRLAATILNQYYGDNCLLRQHSPPKEEGWSIAVTQMAGAISKMSQLVHKDDQGPIMTEMATMLNNKVAPQLIMNKLQSYTEKYPYMQQAVRHALLREMRLAEYCRKGDCDEETSSNHFALNMELYTHFTSPIRRYADIIVHRQLLQMIEEKKAGVTSRSEPSLANKELSDVVAHINEQALAAKTSEDLSQRQYLAYYLMPRISERVERVEALVMSLGNRAFTVYVPKYCIEIKCNVMKQFVPVPQSIVELEQTESGVAKPVTEEEGEKGANRVIDVLTIAWFTQGEISENSSAEEKMKHLAMNRSIELRPLKRVLIDLDIHYESVPLDVFAYNIWEFEEQIESGSGSTLPCRNRIIASPPAELTNSPHINEVYIRDQKDMVRREKREKFKAKDLKNRRELDSTGHDQHTSHHRGGGSSRGGGRGGGHNRSSRRGSSTSK